ncbi:MAG TPA: glycosyltransferase family 87 protein [Terriglobales bacterium]|nr:glycosyltransferase family 87 protein [Terriglobales bacterium]
MRVTILGTSLIVVLLAAILLPRSITAYGLRTTDFTNFYAAGSIVLHGQRRQLYDPRTQEPVLRPLLRGDYYSFEYFIHPPFEALLFVPLARLSFVNAFVAWTCFGLWILAALPLILMPCVPLIQRKPSLALLGFIFFPALATLKMGQDSIVLLLILSAAYCLMQSSKPVAAGLVLCLAAIKFQYLIVLAPLLLLERRFRLFAALCAGAACLALLSVWTVGLAGILSYVRLAGSVSHHLEFLKQVNARGFVFALGSRHVLFWSGMVSLAIFGVAILIARIHSQAQQPLAFAAYLVVAVLASPYAHFSDVTVLLLSLLLAIDWLISQPHRGTSAKLLALAAGLMFAVPYVLIVAWPHYARMYLMFPVLLFFFLALVGEIYSSRAAVLAQPSRAPANLNAAGRTI